MIIFLGQLSVQIDWNANDKYDAESPPATDREEDLVDKGS